jgi:hypothetical protein
MARSFGPLRPVSRPPHGGVRNARQRGESVDNGSGAPGTPGPHAHSTPPVTVAPPGETPRRKSCIPNKPGGEKQQLFKVEATPDANGAKPAFEAPSQPQVKTHE